jgi:hypothetical protein
LQASDEIDTISLRAERRDDPIDVGSRQAVIEVIRAFLRH